MSWDTLLGILAENQAIAEQEASAEPVICPNDTEVLLRAPDGGLFCPFDGWRP